MSMRGEGTNYRQWVRSHLRTFAAKGSKERLVTGGQESKREASFSFVDVKYNSAFEYWWG
jgi:hypothetical protein